MIEPNVTVPYDQQARTSDEADWADVRSFAELRSTGLLWLINRVVFHPRGYALAVVLQGDTVIGWKMMGNGTEVWAYGDNEDDLFDKVEAFLANVDGGGL